MNSGVEANKCLLRPFLIVKLIFNNLSTIAKIFIFCYNAYSGFSAFLTADCWL